MTILGDVFRELFGMFVADLRLTLSVLGGVLLVAILMNSAVRSEEHTSELQSHS